MLRADSDLITAEDFAAISGVEPVGDIPNSWVYTIRELKFGESIAEDVDWIGVEFTKAGKNTGPNDKITIQTDRAFCHLENPTWGELRVMCGLLMIEFPKPEKT